jgi:hypothetical protein
MWQQLPNHTIQVATISQQLPNHTIYSMKQQLPNHIVQVATIALPYYPGGNNCPTILFR